MGEHAIEDPPAMSVVVHPEFEEMAQKAARLRDPESKRVLDLWPLATSCNHRIEGSVAVGALVAEERDEIAGSGEANAGHRCPGGLVPKIVDLEGSEVCPGRE